MHQNSLTVADMLAGVPPARLELRARVQRRHARRLRWRERLSLARYFLPRLLAVCLAAGLIAVVLLLMVMAVLLLAALP